MDNFNIDENSINKLKDMMNKGELSDIISQIPPEMFQNFSNMMSSSNTNEVSNSTNNGDTINSNNNITNKNKTYNTSTNNTPNKKNNNFDFSKIDMNTVMKMTSVINKMNSTNDPRTNLLNSLKPYLREERKGKLDQYANFMNVAKLAELFNSENQSKEKKSDD